MCWRVNTPLGVFVIKEDCLLLAHIGAALGETSHSYVCRMKHKKKKKKKNNYYYQIR